MAAKIFRVHQDGPTAQAGWFDSAPITTQQLETIISSDKTPPTSIPSPFARIDLVKSAFRWVAQNGITGNTSKHKLVADALDVAQLFFLSNTIPGLEIREYKPLDSIIQLSNNGNASLGDTLKTYWQQDGAIYNFPLFDRMFLLYYQGQLLGGTSPSTLFFANPGVAEMNLNFSETRGNDTFFNPNNYAGLQERTFNFKNYIYSLSETPQFKSHFTQQGFDEFQEYLNQVKGQLPAKEQLILNNHSPTSISEYDRCHVFNNPTNYCEILGIPLGLKKESTTSISSESDFVVDSNINDNKPLILPNDTFTQNWVYTTSDVTWNAGIMNGQVPEKNVNPIENSVLPVQNDPYPWLGVGNFLEDKLIRLPYDIDSTKFEVGGNKRFLLPVTETFLEYFTPEQTQNIIKIDSLSGGGANVTLEIPVRGGNIILTKRYTDNNVVDLQVHLAILPFVKSPVIDLEYNLSILTNTDIDPEKIAVSPTNKGQKIQASEAVLRSSKQQTGTTSLNYTSKGNFDALQITIGSHKGVVIPKFREAFSGHDDIKFSVDFGTTNTHIEYTHGNQKEKSLDLHGTSGLWESLADRNSESFDDIIQITEDFFEQELAPYKLGSKPNQPGFPTRTALAYNKTTDFSKPVSVFRHHNINFLLEHKFRMRHLNGVTDLKWSDYRHSTDKEQQVKGYIENLLKLIYYKTLSLNCNPRNVKLIWMYPVSMDEQEKGRLDMYWKKLFNELFQPKTENQITQIPESIAPYLYYKPTATGLSLSMDIGGGSTDISVFKEGQKEPLLISSYKFAGNAIFGDGYPHTEYEGQTDTNGFVREFETEILNILKGHKKAAILNEILTNTKKSAEFSNFLFSLEKDPNIAFNYAEKIGAHPKLKLPIFIFYAASTYYAAKVCKLSNIEIPNNLLLSGTGAKTARILDSSPNLKKISKLVSFIFKSVYEVESATDIKIMLSDIPKEISCIGGLKFSQDLGMDAEHLIKFWIGGKNESLYNNAVGLYENVAQLPKYKDARNNNHIEEDLKSSILEFYSILDSFVDSILIENEYGISISAYQQFKDRDVRELHLGDYLIRGLASFHKDDETPIQETLFFYPLIGILNQLTFKLSQ